MHNPQINGPVDDLKEKVLDYVDLKVEEAKLKATKKGAKIMGRALSVMLLMLVISLTILFMLVTVAYLLGNLLGSPAYGFAIMTGELLIAVLVIAL